MTCYLVYVSNWQNAFLALNLVLYHIYVLVQSALKTKITCFLPYLWCSISTLFWFDIAQRDFCPVSNIMEVDRTQLVVLKAPLSTLKILNSNVSFQITQDNPQTLLLAVTLIFLTPIYLLGMRDLCS